MSKRISILVTVSIFATLIVLPLTIFAIVFIEYSKWLTHVPLLPGIDGPYYLLQVKHLDEYGRLRYPDPPIAFYLLYPWYKVFNDKIKGLEIGMAFYIALISLLLYVVLSRIGRKRVCGVIGALIFAFSNYTLRLVGDFWKNTIGLLWVTLLIYGLYRFEKKRTLGSLLIIVSTFILTALTHILDFGLSLLILISYSTISLLSREYRKDKIFISLVSFIALTCVILAVFPALTGYDVMKFVGFVREMFSEELVEARILSSPVLIIGFVTLVYGLVKYLRGVRRELAKILLVVSIAAVVLNLPIIPREFLWRFLLMNGYLLGVVIALSIAYLNRLEAITFALLIGTVIIYPTIVSPKREFLPSIVPAAYDELKRFVNMVESRFNNHYTLFIPDPKLRYWAETLTWNVSRRPPKPEENIAVIMVRLKPESILRAGRRSSPPPPRIFVKMFEGMFIEAYILKAKPHRPRRP